MIKPEPQRKLRILIVSRYLFPENNPRAFRTTELAKEFARQGHEVAVLIPNLTKEKVAFARTHGFCLKNLGQLQWKAPDFGNSNLGYLLTRTTYRVLQLGFEYPDIELLFKVNKALKKEKGYDLLISIAVPHPIHWGVASAWKRGQNIARTWVADCGDPYMGCDTDSFRKLFHFKFIEKWFMRKADFVTIPIESARQAYYPEFHQKIRIIPQGFHFESTQSAAHTHQNPVPTFAYAGGFIPGRRDPGPFLDYLLTVQEGFKFIVYSQSPGLTEPYLKKLNGRLELRPVMPRHQLMQEMAAMDFLVNFDNNTPTALPSKLIDYAILGKPILNIQKDLDVANIRRFLEGNYSGAYQVENIDQYRIENVCAKFLALASHDQ